MEAKGPSGLQRNFYRSKGLRELWRKFKDLFGGNEVRFDEDKVKFYGRDEKDWLIIFYGAADNNLKDYVYYNINDIEEKAPTRIAHTVALMDAGEKFWAFQGAKVFYVQPDDSFSEVRSPILADLGQVNTADPEFMANFITEAMKKFPAKHVAVIISSHGSGWYGALPDESHGEAMSLSELKKAFREVYQRTGKKIDLLGWDACLMGTAEVGYALRPYVKYMVASEAKEGMYGWYYLQVMDSLNSQESKDLTPERFAKTIVEAIAKSAEYGYNQVDTLSAVSLEKADELAKKLDAFAKALLKTSTPRKRLLYLIASTESFDYEFADIADFAKKIAESKEIRDEQLKRTAEELYKFITEEYVVANYRNPEKRPNAHGVSIELPLAPSTPKSYARTDLAEATHWDEAVRKITRGY